MNAAQIENVIGFLISLVFMSTLSILLFGAIAGAVHSKRYTTYGERFKKRLPAVSWFGVIYAFIAKLAQRDFRGNYWEKLGDEGQIFIILICVVYCIAAYAITKRIARDKSYEFGKDDSKYSIRRYKASREIEPIEKDDDEQEQEQEQKRSLFDKVFDLLDEDKLKGSDDINDFYKLAMQGGLIHEDKVKPAMNTSKDSEHDIYDSLADLHRFSRNVSKVHERGAFAEKYDQSVFMKTKTMSNTDKQLVKEKIQYLTGNLLICFPQFDSEIKRFYSVDGIDTSWVNSFGFDASSALFAAIIFAAPLYEYADANGRSLMDYFWDSMPPFSNAFKQSLIRNGLLSKLQTLRDRDNHTAYELNNAALLLVYMLWDTYLDRYPHVGEVRQPFMMGAVYVDYFTEYFTAGETAWEQLFPDMKPKP